MLCTPPPDDQPHFFCCSISSACATLRGSMCVANDVVFRGAPAGTGGLPLEEEEEEGAAAVGVTCETATGRSYIDVEVSGRTRACEGGGAGLPPLADGGG